MAAAVTWKEKPPLPMNCSECRHDEDKRREWGCDSDLEEVPEGLRFDCFVCHIGENDWDEDHIDPDCTVCDGTGEWGPRRCPMKVVTKEAMAICESLNLLELGLLPHGGGIRDYPAVFGKALSVVSRERSMYQEQAREADASKAKTGAK